MLDSIILFSLRNKLIIGFLTLMLVVWGFWSLSRLPIDAVPDITNNQVQVITYSPTLSPTEVERLITAPVEMELSNMPDLQEIRSLSRFGLSVITAVFSDETDVYKARQLVSERLGTASEKIPADLGRPEMGPVSTGLGEIFQYKLEPDPGFESKYELSELRTIQDWIVRKALLGTPGVADVSSFGGYLKQYEIAVNPSRLRSLGISISDVFEAVSRNNGNSGGAYIAKGPQAWYIRSEGMVQDLGDIGKIPLKLTENGLPLLVRDVAELRFGHSVRYGALTSGDKGEAVGGIVLMLKGENSGQVSKAVKERIKDIEKMLPEGLHFSVYLDRSDLVNRAVSTVKNNLIEGALIVIFVLVLILGNLRAGLVVASVIPLAMLFAIGMMQVTGVSGNLMSLGAIDFGLIVDGAVIIVEATLHHLQLVGRGRLFSREEMDREVFHSASRMMNSAAFGELIILIVYLPVLALVGIEGKMFAPMAKTVAYAIAGAFILSLTYVPVASSLFLSRKQSSKASLSDRMVAKVFRGFEPLLAWFLGHRKTVLAVCLCLLSFSIWVFAGMGGEFIPALDEGDLAVETRLIPGTSMEKTIDVTLRAARILRERFPEVKDVVGKIGTSEIPTDPMPFEACDLMVLLHEKETWTTTRDKEELIQKMEAALAEIPGVDFGFQQPIQMRFNELMTGAKQDVAIKIYGENLDSLTLAADRLGKLVQSVQGVQDLYIEQISGLPEMVARLKREDIARYGLSVQAVNDAIRTGFAGAVAGQVFEGERRFDIAIRLDTASRKHIDDIRNLTVSASGGQLVPISELADVSFRPGPNQIQRDNANRRITVAFNVRGRDVESLVEEIKGLCGQKLLLPEGYHYSVGGQFRNLQEAKARLSVAVPAALALIFLLLFLSFNSVVQATLIFSAIPLSAIGGIFALWLRDMPFSISAGVGFIALFGVAVLNGIVLMAEFNAESENTHDTASTLIMRSVRVRFRPVIMTAMVASLGFLPMAISSGAGAEVQKPLATVVIGGLVSATLLTLLILPVLYSFTWKKPASAGKIIAGAGLLLLLFRPVQAQQVMNFEQAYNLGLKNSYEGKAIFHESAAAGMLARSGYSWSKTSIQTQNGQYNSQLQDQNYSISQNFQLPAVFRNQKRFNQSQYQSAKLDEIQFKADFWLALRTEFENLHHSRKLKQLLSGFDSLVVSEVEMAEMRLKAGETAKLELALARRQEAELSLRKFQAETEEKAAVQQISLLVRDSLSARFEADAWGRNALSGARFSDSSLPIKKARALEEADAARLAMEKSTRLPEFMLGYFNQSLNGIPIDGRLAGNRDRFQGLNFGIQVPLLPASARNRIEAAGERVKAAGARVKAEKNKGDRMVRELEFRIESEKARLEMLEGNSLRAVREVYDAAMEQWKAGNAGFQEVLIQRKALLQLQDEILLIQHRVSLAGIELFYLTNEKWN
jgi:cobalt-zinc-cadmium resistance protein CzcA